jgi:aminocarboxymuconate-semialdehyde decarboxylase
MLGSDYPFPLGELNPGSLIQSSKYSNELKEKLLFKNGMKFIGAE